MTNKHELYKLWPAEAVHRIEELETQLHDSLKITASEMDKAKQAEIKLEATIQRAANYMHRCGELKAELASVRADLQREVEICNDYTNKFFAAQAELAAMREQAPVAEASQDMYGEVTLDFLPAWEGQICKLYAKPTPAIPDGMVLVPNEPTKQMLDAGFNTKGRFSSVYGVYKNMIETAQQEEYERNYRR